MLRVIVRQTNIGAAANVGGPVDTTYRTFDVEVPAVEAYLRERIQYTHREAIGVEVLPDALAALNGDRP